MLAVLWLITSVFLVDVLLLMSIPQRIVAWLISSLLVGWVFWHYTKPWLGVKEDVVDLALLVEKNQHIDSDLVAALQFQETEANTWGSSQLESAVIDYVEDFTPSLDVFEGFTYRRFKRRLGWVMGTVLTLAALAVIFPNYAKAFGNRMLLGSMRYPSDTNIHRISLNGQTVFVKGGDSLTITCAYGTPLNFEVFCQGELPEKGHVRLKAKEGDNHVEVELTRGLVSEPVTQTHTAMLADAIKPAPSSTSQTNGATVYHGNLPRLVNAVTYQVFLGDTWSDPLEVNVIPLPVVTVTLDPKPPKYAIPNEKEKNAEDAVVREGTRQIAVIEGTSVTLQLESSKNLKQAVMTVEGNKKPLPLRMLDKDGKRWGMGGANSPLYHIRKPVRYSLQVEDTDGLVLDHPIEGYLRIRADRKPRIFPPVLKTNLVIPSGKPTVDFHVTDDYGLSRLAINVQVVRKVPMTKEDQQSNSSSSSDTPGNTESEDTDQNKMKDDVNHISLDMLRVSPKYQPQKELSGRYALDLSRFQLSPGDELKVSLEAFDYRGDFPEQSSISEPLILKVTDERGFRLGLNSADERSNEIIEKAINTITGDTK